MKRRMYPKGVGPRLAAIRAAKKGAGSACLPLGSLAVDERPRPARGGDGRPPAEDLPARSAPRKRYRCRWDDVEADWWAKKTPLEKEFARSTRYCMCFCAFWRNPACARYWADVLVRRGMV